LVDCLPELGPPGRNDTPIAHRLWCRLSATAPTPARVAALNSALVLLADHEMAASTFAARVTASTWADPYLVVLSGMATLAGPLHGGASRLVRAMLRDAVATSPEAAIGALLRNSGGIPGTGHIVYLRQDPRASALMDAVKRTRPPAALWRTAQDTINLAAAHQGPLPNIDFAIGLLEEAFEMPDGAGEAIFSVARTAGFIAHAIEEYEHQLRYRPRAAYTGPP
jgi:citrate synthase